MWVNEENGDAGGTAYAVDHAAELNVTSIAMETDEGAFSPYALAFSGHPAAMNQLTILADLLAPLGAGNVTAGGGGTDIGPMCSTGVPCAALEVLDPREGGFSNNPCLGFSTTAPPGTDLPGSISPGYFWFHHTYVHASAGICVPLSRPRTRALVCLCSAGDTLDRMDPVQLQTVAATMAIWAVSIANLPDLLPRCVAACARAPPRDAPHLQRAPCCASCSSGDVPPLPSNSNSGGLSTGAIAGISVGVGIVAIGLVALAWFRLRGQLGGRPVPDGALLTQQADAYAYVSVAQNTDGRGKGGAMFSAL